MRKPLLVAAAVAGSLTLAAPAVAATEVVDTLGTSWVLLPLDQPNPPAAQRTNSSSVGISLIPIARPPVGGGAGRTTAGHATG